MERVRHCTHGEMPDKKPISVSVAPPEKLIEDVKQALASVAQWVALNG